MKLENKYIVIKRDKLAQAFIHCLILDKPWTDGNGLQFVDYPEMMEFLDEAMKFLGNDYFVMNLDEPASQDAMERYFHYHDSDTVPKVQSL
jgi:hypothetical protein